MSNSIKKLLIVAFVFFVVGFLLKVSSRYMNPEEDVVVSKNSILRIDIEGIILNGKKFLKNLDKYKKDDHIKAVVIDINSPGGAVGPSQELHDSIKRVRDEIKKPVVCVTSGLMASGAYYAAVACDKIIVAPGAMVGSIGVIMEFANFGKLYEWAKVNRYSITSGKFKDSGAEYREMRPDERQLFQNMINDVYKQFRDAVKLGRQLKDETLDTYADGRVFTGAKAVELGFADKVGYLDDGIKVAAELAGLGTNYEIFKVPKKKLSIWDLLGSDLSDEDEASSAIQNLSQFASLFFSFKSGSSREFVTSEMATTFLRTKYLNQPMFLIPGYW